MIENMPVNADSKKCPKFMMAAIQRHAHVDYRQPDNFRCIGSDCQHWMEYRVGGEDFENCCDVAMAHKTGAPGA